MGYLLNKACFYDVMHHTAIISFSISIYGGMIVFITQAQYQSSEHSDGIIWKYTSRRNTRLIHNEYVVLCSYFTSTYTFVIMDLLLARLSITL